MTIGGVAGSVPVDEAWAEEAWTAGLEMGRLDAQLAARPARTRAGLSVRTRNARAAEEIAGRHGYRLQWREAGEAGWLWAELRPRS